MTPAEQLAHDDEPTWIDHCGGDHDLREALRNSDAHDIWGQGLTATQVNTMTTLPITGRYL